MTVLRGSVQGAALSAREAQVQQFYAEGLHAGQIGERLGIGVKSVAEYRRRAREKLGLLPRPLPVRKHSLNYHERLREFQRKYMRELRRAADFNMTKAAKLAGLNRTHLYELNKRWTPALRTVSRPIQATKRGE